MEWLEAKFIINTPSYIVKDAAYYSETGGNALKMIFGFIILVLVYQLLTRWR